MFSWFGAIDGSRCVLVFFFFKQKTAYEMRISDWSSDVCSSDLHGDLAGGGIGARLDGAGNVEAVPELDRGRRLGAAGGDRQQRQQCKQRSEERRVGKEGVSTCRSRGSPYPYTKNHDKKILSPPEPKE